MFIGLGRLPTIRYASVFDEILIPLKNRIRERQLYFGLENFPKNKSKFVFIFKIAQNPVPKPDPNLSSWFKKKYAFLPVDNKLCVIYNRVRICTRHQSNGIGKIYL